MSDNLSAIMVRSHLYESRALRVCVTPGKEANHDGSSVTPGSHKPAYFPSRVSCNNYCEDNYLCLTADYDCLCQEVNIRIDAIASCEGFEIQYCCCRNTQQIGMWIMIWHCESP